MTYVDGRWKTVTMSPMGEQQGVLTLSGSGTSFTGDWTTDTGTSDIKDGKVAGDTLTWNIDLTVPMAMTANCKATVTGNTMTGTVTAGQFGSFPMSGTHE
jgi:hypothetical protein